MPVGREALFWIFSLGKMGAHVISRVALLLVMHVFLYDSHHWRPPFRPEMSLEITKSKVSADGCSFSLQTFTKPPPQAGPGAGREITVGKTLSVRPRPHPDPEPGPAAGRQVLTPAHCSFHCTCPSPGSFLTHSPKSFSKHA